MQPNCCLKQNRSEKDISAWGKSTLTELFSNLVLLSADAENTEVSITSVEEVEGEATVALRKAKQIILYDFTVKLCWKGDSTVSSHCQRLQRTHKHVPAQGRPM